MQFLSLGDNAALVPLLLIPAFALTALLYAAIGFGGGSTYTALLALAGTDYRIFPIISLACNVLVVTGGVWRFARAGAIVWRDIWPVMLLSVPAAWLGGQWAVSETLFTGLLGGALLMASIVMVLPQARAAPRRADLSRAVTWAAQLVIGAGLGLLAGIVGIGGGIFLAPLLYLLGWGNPRNIAGTASLFILVNSLAGLAGQWARFDAAQNLDMDDILLSYWPFFPAVIIGGALGSWLGAERLPLNVLRRGTALLILIISVRLLFRAADLS